MSIEGGWGNEYGSMMQITRSGAFLVGLYRSHTGSTGVFRMTGVSRPSADMAGEAVALTIAWRSIDGEPADAGSHWMSGLSGQVFMQGGEPVMILSHVLVASSAQDGVGPGRFIDTLTYRRIPQTGSWGAHQPIAPDRQRPEPARAVDALQGDWTAADATATPPLLTLSIGNAEDGLGLLGGSVRLGGHTMAVSGFVDLGAAAAGLDRQSMTLAGRLEHACAVVAFSGWLDLRGHTLELMQLQSTTTTFGDRYTQTRASFLMLRRLG